MSQKPDKPESDRPSEAPDRVRADLERTSRQSGRMEPGELDPPAAPTRPASPFHAVYDLLSSDGPDHPAAYRPRGSTAAIGVAQHLWKQLARVLRGLGLKKGEVAIAGRGRYLHLRGDATPAEARTLPVHDRLRTAVDGARGAATLVPVRIDQGGGAWVELSVRTTQDPDPVEGADESRAAADPGPFPEDAGERLAAQLAATHEVREQFRADLQDLLDRLAGRNGPRVEVNRAVADGVNALLLAAGLELWHDGRRVSLRYLPAKGETGGSFQVRTGKSGARAPTGRAFPRLEVRLRQRDEEADSGRASQGSADGPGDARLEPEES